MSFSLRLRHGDLALEGNSFGSVSGGQKLVQDLRCALLTPLGFNEDYPEYGSVLDGEQENGIIGEINSRMAATRVQAEIGRVCEQYQRQQISRNQADANRFGRPTITPDETLLSVKSIHITPIESKIVAVVTLQTGGGHIKVNIPVSE